MIDSHVHVVSPDLARYPRAREDLAGSHYATDAVSAETLLELIQAEGVDKVVLVQAFGVYAFDNQYVADAARACPDRFAFVCGVDPLADDVRVAAEHWVGLGARGLRAMAVTPDFDPGSLLPLFEVAAASGTCLCLLATPGVLGRLAAILSEFSGVPLVLDHCGLQRLSSEPDDLGAPHLFELARFDNVRLKVSTRVFNQLDGDAGLALEKLVGRFGSHRVLWGSDFPASVGPNVGPSPNALAAYASTIRTAHELTSRLSASDRKQVLHTTSEELWSPG